MASRMIRTIRAGVRGLASSPQAPSKPTPQQVAAKAATDAAATAAQVASKAAQAAQAAVSSARAQAAAASIGGRLQDIADPLIYYGRVGLEFFAQIAKHQKLNVVPNVAEAQAGFANFFQAFQNGAWKKVTVSQALQFGVEGVKIYGFFLVGEIIGRGSLVGYKIEGSGHHGDHH